MIRVAQHASKIDDAIKFAARLDPSVDCLTSGLFGFRIVAGHVYALERIDRRANHFDAMCVSTCNQLSVSADHILRAADIDRVCERELSQFGTWKTDIIKPLEQHDMRHSRKAQDVPIKARNCTLTEARQWSIA